MLTGQNLILRTIKTEDIPDLNKWRNNIKNKILAQGFRFPVSEAIDQHWLEDSYKDNGKKSVYFGIEEKKSGDFIGIIQLTDIDWISGTAVIGILIGDKSKGYKGYSVEATMLLLNYAFNILNLRKIVSYNLGFNNTTQKIQAKIGGFIKEGCLKKHVYLNDDYHNVLIYSIFKSEFNKREDIEKYIT